MQHNIVTQDPLPGIDAPRRVECNCGKILFVHSGPVDLEKELEAVKELWIEHLEEVAA